MLNKARGHLYLIPVPIDQDSNACILLEKYRKIVETLDHFIVENEKTARFYLSTLDLKKPINQLHFNVLDKASSPDEITTYLHPLLEGSHIGLLSESGCPAVADPGSKMIALAHKNSIKVIPLIGPSSIVLALMASGLNGQQFKFHGYLPSEKDKRIKKIIGIENESKKSHETQIFIETPYRNQRLFNDLLDNLHEKTNLCVAINITSEDEYILTRDIKGWRQEKLLDLKNKPCVFLIQT